MNASYDGKRLSSGDIIWSCFTSGDRSIVWQLNVRFSFIRQIIKENNILVVGIKSYKSLLLCFKVIFVWRNMCHCVTEVLNTGYIAIFK